MKKVLLASLFVAGSVSANAQAVIDTVSVGAAYANNVWYSLANDEQGSAPKNNWDLAFDVSGFGSTIHINSVGGVSIWKYPKNDTTGWSSIDTTGIGTWKARANSDTSWAYGAIGRYADPGDPYDLDWGKYNITTHTVIGDSIFIVKLSDGSYRKLWIESLVSNVYNVKYANLDGTGAQTLAFDKTTYSGKNFGYYSLLNNAALNREPATANWDLVFGQYSALIPNAYTVTGVLSNVGIETAVDSSVANVATFVTWAPLTFHHEINTIGYDWKTFGGTSYSFEDSTVYFLKQATGDVWKIVMTGFGGSANGNIIFSKEKVYTNTTGVPGIAATNASVALYPNPAVSQAVNVVYSFGTATDAAVITICDMAGKVVLMNSADGSAGLHRFVVPAGMLSPGLYIVDVRNGNNHNQQKLIIQ